MTVYDIFFDSTHDIALSSSDIKFAEDSNIVKQRLTIRLQFALGEWFLNNTVGLPFAQFIFLQGSNLADIHSVFRKEIKDTTGVSDITKLELTPAASNKSLQVDFEVNSGSISGSVEVSI